MNICISQHLIDKIEIDDVNHELRTEFGFYSADDTNEFIVTNEETSYHESEIVNIDTLINSLETLKKMGSTHVSVDWHCDHLSYELYGYAVNYAEDHEIEDYQNKQKLKADKRKQITELQKQIVQLRSDEWV